MTDMTPQQQAQLLKLAGQATAYGGQYDPSMAAVSPYLGNAGSAYGIYNGVNSGTWQGDVGAAGNAAKLYGKLSGDSSLNAGAQGGLNALGIYQGIKQGGVAGYGSAAANGAQLAGSAFGNSALEGAGGYIAAPLAVYNAVKNYQSGKTGSDALQGAEAGAAVGSIIPGVGTIIGGVVGGLIGAGASAFGPGAKDPEQGSWTQYATAYKKDPTIGSSVSNPYMELAGLMDSRAPTISGDIPFYTKYGRKGEQAFTNDMTGQLQSAMDSGAMTKNADGTLSVKTDANGINPNGGGTVIYQAKDVPAEAYANVVAPWINKMGKWDDPNQAAQQSLLTQMAGQYVNGTAGQNWKATGGDTPFANLPGQAAAAPAVTPTPATQRQMMMVGHQGLGGAQTMARGGRTRKVHYDDGGAYTYDDTAPQLTDFGDAGTGWTDSDNSFSDLNQSLGDGSYVNAQNDPYAYYTGSSGSGSGSGSSSSGLSSLLGALGISGSTASSLAPYAAMLPILNQLLGGNKGATAPSLPSQYGGTALNIPTPSNPRQATNPQMPMSQWLTAGTRPEQQFYTQNAIPATAMSAPNQQAAQAAAAASPAAAPVAQAAPAPRTNDYAQAVLDYGDNGNAYGAFKPMAAGGPYDDPAAAYGTSAVGHVKGPGDGTSDSIRLKNAYLSNGEYVMDAPTVSLLGNGSNDAGANWLDGFRKHVRKGAGKHFAKGKQPMNSAAVAAQYAYGGVV